MPVHAQRLGKLPRIDGLIHQPNPRHFRGGGNKIFIQNLLKLRRIISGTFQHSGSRRFELPAISRQSLHRPRCQPLLRYRARPRILRGPPLRIHLDRHHAVRILFNNFLQCRRRRIPLPQMRHTIRERHFVHHVIGIVHKHLRRRFARRRGLGVKHRAKEKTSDKK